MIATIGWFTPAPPSKASHLMVLEHEGEQPRPACSTKAQPVSDSGYFTLEPSKPRCPSCLAYWLRPLVSTVLVACPDYWYFTKEFMTKHNLESNWRAALCRSSVTSQILHVPSHATSLTLNLHRHYVPDSFGLEYANRYAGPYRIMYRLLGSTNLVLKHYLGDHGTPRPFYITRTWEE